MLRPSTTTRHAGVGHGADRLGGELHHALDGFERGLGTHGAIDADHVHRPFVQLAGITLRYRCRRGRLPSSSMVTCATMAIRRRQLRGRRKSPRAFRPDRRRFRAPAGRRRLRPATSACSRKIARASANEVGPSGSMRTPSGPIAPATKACSRAASRARRTPAWLMAS